MNDHGTPAFLPTPTFAPAITLLPAAAAKPRKAGSKPVKYMQITLQEMMISG